jgi:hypothetical protein
MHLATTLTKDKQEAILRLIEDTTPPRFKAVQMPAFPSALGSDYLDVSQGKYKGKVTRGDG